MGSNIMFGEISYITKAISAVLQLGVTMDFSIFLYDKYRYLKSKGKTPVEAIDEAIQETFNSVTGSSLTTIAGFLSLCGMSLTLGKDIGLVMAKGVLMGLICVLTILPSLLIIFDKVIERTHHKIIFPQFKLLQNIASKHYKIITVIAGWDTVSNENAGVVGQLEESRTALETRRALSVAKNSHGSRLSLQGSIASIDGVLDCLVLENKSNATVTIQGVSLISHSVAICVYGGADNDIAEMIYNKLDAGCGTNGSTTVTYTSGDGVPNSYQIVRPAPTNLYVEVTINETATTPATIEDDIKNAIVDDFNGLDVNSGNLRRGCGQTIYASSFSVALIKSAGVSDLVSIEIGRSAGTYTNSVIMDADEEPILTAENINVVMNPLS
jgi:hypothetical protein